MENDYKNYIKNIKKNLKVKDRLILSLDVPNKLKALEVLQKVNNNISIIKVGLELIYNEGLEIVSLIKKAGYKVLLDAKLMDIPNTISGAINGISKLDVDMITIHTFGGHLMLKSANDTLKEIYNKKNKVKPLLMGVTVLTSLDNNDLVDFGFNIEYTEVVLKMAKIAIKSEIDGIICSPNEVRMLRENFGDDFLIATPGIRLNEDSTDDQKRINTPQKAIADGADFIIAGRSILNSDNIPNTIDLFLKHIQKEL